MVPEYLLEWFHQFQFALRLERLVLQEVLMITQ